MTYLVMISLYMIYLSDMCLAARARGTAQRSAAQPGTAQHSTARHRTAPKPENEPQRLPYLRVFGTDTHLSCLAGRMLRTPTTNLTLSELQPRCWGTHQSNSMQFVPKPRLRYH